MRMRLFRRCTSNPGAAPGIEHDEIRSLPGGPGQASITCIDYAPDNVAKQEVTDLNDFLDRHRPYWSAGAAGCDNCNETGCFAPA